ncbi:MAG: hypothetical protein AB7I33_02915 [Gemmatimonadales bacterium]
MISTARRLWMVKLAHTIVWAFFVGCIAAIPVFGWAGHYDRAFGLTGIVLIEVLVLGLNGWRCPLTAVAARYTEDRRDNFDIFLPLWLARYNKEVFGTLFVGGVLFTLIRRFGGLG